MTVSLAITAPLWVPLKTKKCHTFRLDGTIESRITFVFDFLVLGEDIKCKGVIAEPKRSTKMYDKT